ncbi:hypothetical protein CLIB1444_01S01288 [[Candida] jaroonii]|uniref:Uncharacterized protein n=1 Tax=[Candida] jaroonii TaxID=467808 RepID=A0ACA9XZY5_9ASCO|nr:hypothetical protein CLIB1444_01S01288 [[Candida] jaroonii]
MDKKRLELHSFSATDLQYRGSQTPKASPTTSTSTNFYNSIDKDKKKLQFTGKPKKLKDLLTPDPLFETEKIKLLFKLYLPRKKSSNDANSLKQLKTNLPLLLPHSNDTTLVSYPKLNFELHLFLASIMCEFVNSWYLTKLNTDNFDFIVTIYNILCDFIKDLAFRMSKILNGDNLLFRIDELSSLLNTHLIELIDKEDQVKIIRDYHHSTANSNIINHELTDEEIMKQYLKTKHVSFEGSDTRGVYLRVLVRKILSSTFNDDNPGVLNSEIGTNFVVSILSDLVFNNIISKLSTPEFIFSNIKRVVDTISRRLDKPQPKPKSLQQRMKGIFSMSYKDLSYLMIWNEGGIDTNYNILDNKVFQLLDTITGFSNRKPLLFSIIHSVKEIMGSNNILSGKINRILKKYLFRGLVQSNLLNDDTLSKIISDLRMSIFNKPIKEDVNSPITMDSLANDIYNLINHERLPLSLMKYLKFKGETKEDTLKSIKSTLLVFNYDPKNAVDHLADQSDTDSPIRLRASPIIKSLKESCELNELFMIQIVDLLVAKLYPELV